MGLIMKLKFKNKSVTMDQLNEYVEVQECITVEDWGLYEGGYYIVPYFPEDTSESDISRFEMGLL